MIGRLVLVNPIGAHLKEEKNLIWRLEGVSEDTLEPYHLGIYIIFLNTLHLLASAVRLALDLLSGRGY